MTARRHKDDKAFIWMPLRSIFAFRIVPLHHSHENSIEMH